jgi:hypothetical protein
MFFSLEVVLVVVMDFDFTLSMEGFLVDRALF